MHMLCDQTIATLIEAVRAHSDAAGPTLDSLSHLSTLLEQMEMTRVLLVVDRGAIEACGAGPVLREQLGSRLVAEFDAFTPNPSSDQAAAAADAIVRSAANGVVALGGGSCLDVAKVGALAAANRGEITSIAEGRALARLPSVPCIAIPTTSGTGSEATHFAAIYVRGRKVSVADASMRPAAKVMDASLHAHMPARLAAATGLDALAQSLESMWAVGSTDESLVYSRLGAALVSRNLVESVRTASADSREAMMWGAHAAGMAINISKTTAPHALSYQLTSRFALAHGHAAALTLGHIGRENARVEKEDCRDPRGAGWVRARVQEAAAALGVQPQRLPAAIAILLGRLHLPNCLRDAGVSHESLSSMAQEVDPVRLSNNPRLLGVRTLTAALEAAWMSPDLTGSAD